MGRIIRIGVTYATLIGVAILLGFLLFVGLSRLDGVSSQEQVDKSTHSVTIDERFRELEQRVVTIQAEAALAKWLALAGSSENALAATYADMASTYYGTMWSINGSGITREAAASRIGEAVASDDQLAELWALVITDQAPVRTFELLLLTKLWVSMTRGLAPALDG